MARAIQIENKKVGEGFPVYIVGEIGINHNGDLEIAKKLIKEAFLSGLDAVKFQNGPLKSVCRKHNNPKCATPLGATSAIWIIVTRWNLENKNTEKSKIYVKSWESPGLFPFGMNLLWILWKHFHLPAIKCHLPQ